METALGGHQHLPSVSGGETEAPLGYRSCHGQQPGPCAALGTCPPSDVPPAGGTASSLAAGDKPLLGIALPRRP